MSTSGEVLDRLNAALAGRYRVARELGEGGMATVFLADDLKHDRQVAIKVLKPELAAVVGAERFLAEIRTTANLQHPYILPLHDSGEAESFLFYVMPYVKGESLRERLDREKQLPVGEAVDLAGKVADALDYAHEQGVVHRDIKPGNILLSGRGDPLVADFGIALAVTQAGGGRITETGLSMGTPHYMSPEQATGDRDVDPRSDVYALACVLYEMLAGQPPFAAPTAQAVLARILTEDARDVREIRRTVPEHVASTLARALEKLPADRFENAGQFKGRLADEGYRYETRGAAPIQPTAGRGSPAQDSEARSGSRALPLAAAAIAGLAVGALAVATFGGGAGPSGTPGLGTTVRMPLDTAVQFGPQSVASIGFDVSPDGSMIVLTEAPGGPLEVIELDGPARRELPGTDGGQFPVFSPTGRWIAFLTQDLQIARVALDGGAPTTIAPASLAFLSAWGEEGALYYSAPDAAYRLAEGGDPEVILDKGLYQARSVRPIRGGRAILYTDMPIGQNRGTVRVKDLESGDDRVLVEDGFDAWYAPTGHLVHGRPDQSMVAVGFDADRLEVTGLPQVVLDSVVTEAFVGAMSFRLAGNGTAVYLRGSSLVETDSVRIAFVAADGTIELPPVRPATLQSPTVSPDGRLLAYARESQLFLFDLVTYEDRPVAAPGEGLAIGPVWSPDGGALAFAGLGSGDAVAQPAVRSLEPSAEIRRLPIGGVFGIPVDWTPDGSQLLSVTQSPEDEGGSDLLVVDTATGSVTPYLRTRYAEGGASLSPDGRWAAYVSDESGRNEVYVRSFPDPGPSVRVSEDGGGTSSFVGPRWSPEGDVIYYPKGDSIWSVPVDGSGEAFTRGEPEPLLSLQTQRGRLASSFTVHPDGRIVTTLTPRSDTPAGEGEDAELPPPPRAYVVVNWLAEMLDRIEGR